jgi:hypothetical protein
MIPTENINLYDMQLHEIRKIVYGDDEQGRTYIYITKVAGGWIYSLNSNENIFVPYNEEFK